MTNILLTVGAVFSDIRGFKWALDGYGYSVFDFPDGQTALNFLRGRRKPPTLRCPINLILVSADLPDTTGTAFIREARPLVNIEPKTHQWLILKSPSALLDKVGHVAGASMVILEDDLPKTFKLFCIFSENQRMACRSRPE
jgi:CheY-like chemotaxis protein